MILVVAMIRPVFRGTPPAEVRFPAAEWAAAGPDRFPVAGDNP